MCSRPSVSGHAVCGHRALASISQTWIPIPSPLDQYQCCARGAEGAAMEQRSCGRRWAVARSIPHGGPSSDATDRAALVGDGLSHSRPREHGSTGCRLGQQACGSITNRTPLKPGSTAARWRSTHRARAVARSCGPCVATRRHLFRWLPPQRASWRRGAARWLLQAQAPRFPRFAELRSQRPP